MVLRLTFFLLVFANLVFFAWAQGYFGGGDPNREPDRLVSNCSPRSCASFPAPRLPGAGADSRRRQRRACLPRRRRPQHGRCRSR
jgi:hypothetical protein